MGEKIKRARIYKGYTLRELCEDKISVSKMSCIENDKIKPEGHILEFLSKKLNLKLDYLSQNVREQISANIEELTKYKTTDYNNYESMVEYNLRAAESNGFYDLAFKLMHMLFKHYLVEGNFCSVQELTSSYYDLCRKNNKEYSDVMYNMDMAEYLLLNKEFSEAAKYYSNVHSILINKQENPQLVEAIYGEAMCYLKLKDYEKAYKVSNNLRELLPYVKERIEIANIYCMFAIISLRKNDGNFNMFEMQSYECYKDDVLGKVKAMYNYIVCMFDLKLNDQAIEYINKVLELYPKKDKKELAGFLLEIINLLIANEVAENGEELCEKALDYAIILDDINLIEKAYYYKSIILLKKNKYVDAEMYMNLSLDTLLKFGSKSDRYKRYMEMGHMYFELKQNNEAIKYFNLAISIDKKM